MMLVVLVALSGCGGLFGHAEQSPGSSDDPFAGVTFPAGASEDGIDNGTVLVANHQRTLSQTDYEISFEIDVRERNRRLVQRSVGTRSSLDSKRAYSIVSEPDRVAEAYRNESTFLSRTFRNGSTTYVSEPLNGSFESEHSRLTGSEAVDIVLRNGNFTADAVIARRDGKTFVRYGLEAADVDESANVTSADGSLVVSEDGVVHGASLRIEGTNRGASYRVDVNYGVVRRGNVSVERPAWADDAARQG